MTLDYPEVKTLDFTNDLYSGLSDIKNYYQKHIYVSENTILTQSSLSKYKDDIYGDPDMKKTTDYQKIIDISYNILNDNGFKVTKEEWFLELHKYHITEDMYKNIDKTQFMREKQNNNGKNLYQFDKELDNFILESSEIAGKKYKRYTDFEWHLDDGANKFDCHTIIYFLRKTPINNVGGNFFWKSSDNSDEINKIKVKDNIIVLMRGDVWHSPGWITTNEKQVIERESIVVQLKKHKL